MWRNRLAFREPAGCACPLRCSLNPLRGAGRMARLLFSAGRRVHFLFRRLVGAWLLRRPSHLIPA
jgi:hypothetical protein